MIKGFDDTEIREINGTKYWVLKRDLDNSRLPLTLKINTVKDYENRTFKNSTRP